MLKLLIGLISTLVLLFVLTLTNPGPKWQKLLIHQKTSVLVDKQLSIARPSHSALGPWKRLTATQRLQQRNALLERLLSKGLSRTNYLLFSTADLDYQGKRYTISYGVLGNVYLTANFEQLVKGMTATEIAY